MKLKKIIEPNRILGFTLFNIGMGSLLYVFAHHLEGTWLAYFSYLSSTYALIIFVVWFYNACKYGNEFLKNNSKLYKFYKNSSKEIAKLSLTISLIFNLIYGLSKLFLGLYYKSEWFITLAIYYLILFFIRFTLIKTIRKEKIGQNLTKEYIKLRHTGIVLLFLDIILSGMIILIIHQNQTVKYSEHLIYLVALCDFYSVINSFINVLKYRKKSNPILTASKCINLSVAMISIISLEVAMIYQFGNNDGTFKMIMTSCTGLGICIINSFMAIIMIHKSSKYLKTTNKREMV